MEELAVEYLGEDDAYYKATLHDVHSDGISVNCDTEGGQAKKLKFTQVRLSSADTGNAAGNFTEIDSVEVWCQANDAEPGCWAPATIKMIKGDFVVLVYCATSIQDIVPVERVRRITKQVPVDKNTFHRFTIDIPVDLRDICMENQAHKEFRKACGASVVRFVPEESIILVISTSERVLKKARMLAEMHLRNLRQKMVIRQHTEEAVSKLASTQICGGFMEEFHVDTSLMGLAIGGQGTNISKAREVTGVNNIELEESTGGQSVFRVYADTQEAATEARTILEFVEDCIKVPKIFVAKIIGKNGRNIHDIVDKSGIARVKFQGENETPDTDSDEGLMSFIVVGTKESVNDAKILMEYNVSHLKEVEVLRIEKEGVDQRLKEATGVGYGYPPYRERRDSSDYEGRGYRGYRGRGRGFRRRGNDRFPSHGDESGEDGAGYYTDSMVSNGRARGFYRGGRRGRRAGGGFFPRDNIPPPRNDSDRFPRSNQSSYPDSSSRRRMPDQDEQASDFSQDQDSYRNRPRRRNYNRRRDGDPATDTEIPSSSYRGSNRGRSLYNPNNPRGTTSDSTHDRTHGDYNNASSESWANMNDAAIGGAAAGNSTETEKPQRKPLMQKPRGGGGRKFPKSDNAESTTLVNGGDVSH